MMTKTMMTTSKTLIAAGLTLLLGSGIAAERVSDNTLPPQAAACAACHKEGDNKATVPALSSQEPEYFKKQVRDFQSGRRSGCTGLSGGLNSGNKATALAEPDIAAIALYFARQPRPALTVTSPADKALGARLYTRGARTDSRFIPACTGCHGQGGGGRPHWQEVMKTPPAILPAAIGRQPEPYVANQLRAFRAGTRSNDASSVMRHLAEHMSDEEIAALATYVAGLAP